MADSSYEKGLSELSKMKVADLKNELKQRGLPTTGNKNELVERLQIAIQDSSLSLDENNEEIIDEDAVLADEEIDELVSKPDSQGEAEKKKIPEEENVTAKKVVLNRKGAIEELKVSEPEKKEETKSATPVEPEKKKIKLSEVGVKERLEMRAKKFGVALSETAKKEARSERFSSNGTSSNKIAITAPTTTVSTNSKVSELDILKKRAERFGTSVSTVMEKVELQERIEKRKARFGEVQPIRELSSKIKIGK